MRRFLGLLILLGYPWIAGASSDAGLDVASGSARIRVTYSVALDYGRAEDCIRDPECLLFDIVVLLQSREAVGVSREQTLQFDLYQSSKKAGNFLSLVRDPYEGGDYKSLYDAPARNSKQQIMSLLKEHLKIRSTNASSQTSIRLYKCVRKEDCEDVLFGSFPSEEMHSGYCVSAGNGCASEFIEVGRKDMKSYFSRIP